MMGNTLSRRDFIEQAQCVALATPFLSLLGCSDDDARDLLSLDGRTMGTSYSVKIADAPRGIDAGALAGEVDGLLETVNRQMSTYRPDSELSRFNTSAAETWVPVSIDTCSVIKAALRVSRLTDGALDPTVGPIVDLWGFGPGGEPNRVPSSEEIAAAHAAVGFAKIELRADETALIKHEPGVRLDLSGIAKGFGVDKMAEHLTARGIDNYLVEIGGELRSSGRGPGEQPWRVGIEKPTKVLGDLQRVIDLNNAALATSGNYRIFFDREGHRYSHIVNPRSGRPVDHDLASATVVAATTMEADALSTSLLVLGPEAGMRLAAKHEIAAFFITGRGGSFTEKSSPAFQRRFKA